MLEPSRIVVAEIGPYWFVMSVSPIGLSIVPLTTRFGWPPASVWSFVIVMSVGSTCRTIANVASAPEFGDVVSVTFGRAVRLIGSMSSMTRSRAEWLMIVTVCQLSWNVNVPQ